MPRALLHILTSLTLFAAISLAPVSARAATASSKLSPADAARLKRALQLLKRNHPAQSRQILLLLVRRNPTKGLLWFNLGNASFALGRYEEAITEFRNVIAVRSPLTPAAKLYVIKAKRKLRQLDEAFRWLNWTMADPSSTPPGIRAELQSESAAIQDSLLSEATALYQSGQYARALARFRQAAQLSRPETPAEISNGIDLMIGLCLLRGESAAMAYDYFRGLSSRITDPQLGAEALALSETFNRTLGGYPAYALQASLAGGYNSNVFGAANEASGISRPTSSFFGAGSFRLFQSGSTSGQMGYSLLWNETVGYPQIRSIRNSVFANFRKSSPEWSFILSPVVEYEFFGPDPYILRGGGSFGIAREESGGGLAVVFSYLSNNGLGDTYSYLSGSSWLLRIQYRKDLIAPTTSSPRSFWIAPYFLIFSEGSGDLTLASGGIVPLANQGAGFGVLADWTLSPRWELEGTAFYSDRHFFYAPGDQGATRIDQQVTGALKVNYRIQRHLSFFQSTEWISNRSTFDATSVSNQDFNQLLVQAGLSWELTP